MTKFFKFSIFVIFGVIIIFSSGNFVNAGTDCCADPTGCTETCDQQGNLWECTDFSNGGDLSAYEIVACKCQGNSNIRCAKEKVASENTDGGAAGILPPQSGTCPNGGNCGSYTLNDFLELGVNVTKWILGIVGSLALLAFLFGGFMMLISEGSSDKVTKAKSIITGAVIGLIIVFSSYLIVDFILKSLGYVNPNTNNSTWDIVKP
ncbi:MAG: hypothetical protein US81_C0001G0041 [Parcubacteria group bacterium GW2011_GWE2_38_18]|nr:MAG: hypothetical protein US81_C0001G0041 [Parcubacteria group bacterium GW2011_GWE2_38_18]